MPEIHSSTKLLQPMNQRSRYCIDLRLVKLAEKLKEAPKCDSRNTLDNL